MPRDSAENTAFQFSFVILSAIVFPFCYSVGSHQSQVSPSSVSHVSPQVGHSMNFAVRAISLANICLSVGVRFLPLTSWLKSGYWYVILFSLLSVLARLFTSVTRFVLVVKSFLCDICHTMKPMPCMKTEHLFDEPMFGQFHHATLLSVSNSYAMSMSVCAVSSSLGNGSCPPVTV